MTALIVTVRIRLSDRKLICNCAIMFILLFQSQIFLYFTMDHEPLTSITVPFICYFLHLSPHTCRVTAEERDSEGSPNSAKRILIPRHSINYTLMNDNICDKIR